MTNFPRHRTVQARNFLAALALLTLTACSVNPATGEHSFTAFMSPEDEVRVGAEEHPKILEQFGGAYENADVAAYVERIGQKLARVSDLPDLKFTFTVLDDDIVNAFALPGGYIYISRGLLGLANNEAELAGVLGHEIGHVTARHSAQRYSRQVAAGLGTTIIGVLGSVFLGTNAVGDLVGQGAAIHIQSFSREQEHEADTLGIRYLARAGYETDAMASFLSSLEAFSTLEAKVSGLPDPAARYNIMSTHPRTAARVVAASRAANAQPVPNPEVGTAAYLKRIDGIVFGDSAREGLVRGQVFAHEPLDFRFEVPPGFSLFNGANQVLARGPQNEIIAFSGANGSHRVTMAAYLTGVWARNAALANVETIDINGMEAATGTTQTRNNAGTFDARLIAIRHPTNRIYRFIFLTPPARTAALNVDLRRTTFSFRQLTAADRARYAPWHVKTVTVRAGDTVESLSRNMPMPGPKDEWFRVINGLRAGAQPTAGQTVKIVTE
jgi:predicted Zn-dependent protease